MAGIAGSRIVRRLHTSNHRSAEGAIALAYPEPANRGRYLSYWLSFRVLGQLIGGVINLSLNADRASAGSISVNTYVRRLSLSSAQPLMLSPHSWCSSFCRP